MASFFLENIEKFLERSKSFFDSRSTLKILISYQKLFCVESTGGTGVVDEDSVGADGQFTDSHEVKGFVSETGPVRQVVVEQIPVLGLLLLTELQSIVQYLRVSF